MGECQGYLIGRDQGHLTKGQMLQYAQVQTKAESRVGKTEPPASMHVRISSHKFVLLFCSPTAINMTLHTTPLPSGFTVPEGENHSFVDSRSPRFKPIALALSSSYTQASHINYPMLLHSSVLQRLLFQLSIIKFPDELIICSNVSIYILRDRV